MPVEHKTSKGVVYYVNTPEELAAEAAEEAAAFAVAVADWRNQGAQSSSSKVTIHRSPEAQEKLDKRRAEDAAGAADAVADSAAVNTASVEKGV